VRSVGVASTARAAEARPTSLVRRSIQRVSMSFGASRRLENLERTFEQHRTRIDASSQVPLPPACWTRSRQNCSLPMPASKYFQLSSHAGANRLGPENLS
jgi:hypothetical protein